MATLTRNTLLTLLLALTLFYHATALKEEEVPTTYNKHKSGLASSRSPTLAAVTTPSS